MDIPSNCLKRFLSFYIQFQKVGFELSLDIQFQKVGFILTGYFLSANLNYLGKLCFIKKEASFFPEIFGTCMERLLALISFSFCTLLQFSLHKCY